MKRCRSASSIAWSATTTSSTHASQWAAELGAGAVVAMGLAKRAIDAGLGQSLAEGLDAEADAFVEVFGTEDARDRRRLVPRTGPRKGAVHRPVGDVT